MLTNSPQNSGYQTNEDTPLVPKNFRYVPKYTPNQDYKALSKMNLTGRLITPSPAVPVAGSQEEADKNQAAMLKWGNLTNSTQGVPTQQPFLPAQGDLSKPIPLPTDYGTFQAPQSFTDNGQNLSWGTPVAPVIKNIAGDVQGQYVEDTTDPNKLVKTIRGTNDLNDTAMKNGRPGSMYQIDHIMPLSLGGADTAANRELLTYGQNDAKTRAQAIPYTLYAYGDISLSQAREMAMKWKGRDITDVPQPNDIGLVSDTGGKTGIEIAREMAKRWAQPAPETLSDKYGKIPEYTKQFANSKWLPSSVKSLLIGAANTFTLGLVPNIETNPEDHTINNIGRILGGVASFIPIGRLVGGGMKVMGLGLAGLRVAKVATTAKAVEAGLAVAEESAVAGSELAADSAAVKSTTDVAKGITFGSLNKIPGYLAKALKDPALQKQMAEFGISSAVYGQMAQFVQNKLQPGMFNGTEYSKDQDNMVGNIFKDATYGAVTGIASPTIKGTAYSIVLPTMLSYLADPDHPVDALTNGVMFGALHAVGTARKTGYNNIEILGGKPYESPVTTAFNTTVNKASHAVLDNYAPEIMGKYSPEEKIPENIVQEAKDQAIQNVWARFFFGKGASSDVKDQTLGNFKNYSTDLNAKLDVNTPKSLDPTEFFSAKARKETTATNKAQEEYISKEYGPGYQTKNEYNGDITAIPEGGMDLQTALTEIKRITVAARQLYKNSLSADMRNKADVDDLLSFTKNNLKENYDQQNSYMKGTPDDLLQSLKAASDVYASPEFGGRDITTTSFKNDQVVDSGKFPVGSMTAAGGGINLNSARVSNFLRDNANTLPTVAIYSRPDVAPLQRLKNKMITQKDIESETYSPDRNPENALQVFGFKWTVDAAGKRTGELEPVELGWVSSDFHLNGKKNSVNRQVREGGWGKEIDHHKDTIAEGMRDNNVDILFADINKDLSTDTTKKSKKPFVVMNVSDNNWNASIKAAEARKVNNQTNPVSVDIAKFNNAKDATEKSQIISDMNKKVVPPASTRVKQVVDSVPTTPKTIDYKMAGKTTEMLTSDLESIDMNDTEAIKEGFAKNFKIFLNDSDAVDISSAFKQDPSTKGGIKILADAYNKHGGSDDVALKLEMTKKFVESGAMRNSKWGAANNDLPLTGGMNNSKSPQSSIMDQIKLVDKSQSEPVNNSVRPEPTGGKAEMPTKTPTATPAPVDNSFSFTKVEPTGNDLYTKMVNEYRKMPMKNPIKIEQGTPSTDKIGEQAKSFILSGRDSMDYSKVSQGDAYSLPEYEKINNAIINGQVRAVRSSLQRIGADEATIKKVQAAVEDDLKAHSIQLLDNLSKAKEMPYESAMNEKSTALAEDLKNIDFTSPAAIKNGFMERFKIDLTPDQLYKINKMVEDGKPNMEDLTKNLPYMFSDLQAVSFPSKTMGDVTAPVSTEINDTFFKDIKRGLGENKASPAYWSAKAADSVFTHIFGHRYNTDPKLAPAHEAISKFFKDIFFNQVSESNNEITQPKKVIEALASGEYGRNSGYGQAVDETKQNNPFRKINSGDQMEFKKVVNEEGAPISGFHISDQGENVHDLTYGEAHLMPGIASDAKMTPTLAVRDWKHLFMKNETGLRAQLQKALGRPISIPENVWSHLEAEAKKAEESFINMKKERNIDKRQLNTLIKKYKTLQKALETGPDKNYEEALSDVVMDMNKYINKLNITSPTELNLKDGGGGPGVHDGKGGFSDMWSGIKDRLGWGNEKYVASDSGTPAPVSYNIRGVPITDSDIENIAPIVFGEVSNRPDERQAFEARHIINTGINRIANNPKNHGYGSNLTEVFQKKGQYNAYAPEGTVNSKGETVESQYQLAKAGKLDAAGTKRYQVVKDILNELKSGKFDDTTNGKMFYTNASDGTLWLGSSSEEAVKNAIDHEKKFKLRRTPFHTTVGMPAHELAQSTN